MRRFGIVFAREFRETLRSKPFIIISVFLALLLIIAAAAGVFLAAAGGADSGAHSSADYTEGGSAAPGDFNVTYFYSVAAEDRTDGDILERLKISLPYIRFEPAGFGPEEIENELKDGVYDAYVIILSATEFEIYEPAQLYAESLGEEISEALTRINRADALEQLGVDAQQAEEILASDEVWYTSYAVGGYDMGSYVLNYVMVILMFLVIGLYGQMVATRVATEKSSRTMEVLAVSVSPTELLCGKVMGVGAAGLLQMLVFIGGGAAILHGVAARSPMLSLVAGQMLNITAGDVLCLIMYFLLGFMLYAFIFGALGSMVSQLEDLSGLASMPLYLFMVGYLIAIMGAAGAQSSIMMKAASFVPFWSPVVMFARMSMEQVPLWQQAVSLLLLAAAAALIAWLSARIYRTGMLRYGKPPRIKEIINAARREQR